MKEERLYIKDVIEILGVNRRTILNWENAGKIPLPKRDPMSGYRIYSKKEVENLKKITGRP